VSVIRGDWPNTDTPRLAWAARETVLDCKASIGTCMDVLDPLGCLREGMDRYGEPLPEEEFGTVRLLDFMGVWTGKLSRANSALRELESRVRQLEEENAQLRKEAQDGCSGSDSGA